jgi:glutamate synthase (NADPH/NADH) small chain
VAEGLQIGLWAGGGEKFTGDKNGRVKEFHTYQVEWSKNEQGAFIPKRIAGTEKRLRADLILLAMGFLGPEDAILDQLRVERDQRSNAKAAYGKFATNLPGVFAAGDCRRGQSLVVWAINEGRGAARECDRYLMGHTGLP